jgi:hypothetical protein
VITAVLKYASQRLGLSTSAFERINAERKTWSDGCLGIDKPGQLCAQALVEGWRIFYALLSCDRTQQSWEFPEMGHGFFTYYLIRGLQGEAADHRGTIEADLLYRYVYHQTLQYIDKTNQQLRLINQQKRSRSEANLQPEYGYVLDLWICKLNSSPKFIAVDEQTDSDNVLLRF